MKTKKKTTRTASLSDSALLLLFACTGVLLGFLGHFEPQLLPDSAGYDFLGKTGLFTKAALSSLRTLGYPLLIWFGALFASSYKAMPLLQYSLLCAATFVFYRGMATLRVPPRVAALIGASVFVTCLMTPFTHPSFVLTDGPGLYFAIAALGLLFQIVNRPSRTLWAVYTSLLFCTYQVRPAYLFTLGLYPLLATFALRCSVVQTQYRQQAWHFFTRHVLIAFAPFLLFCCLRGLVVGHFGLVSFGGTNLIGILGQFLQEETVQTLPPQLRSFAQEMITKRSDPELLATYGLKEWKSPTFGKTGVTASVIAEYYNYTIWQVADEIATRQVGTDPLRKNRLYSGFNREMMKRSFLFYGIWVVKAFCRSVIMAFAFPGVFLGVGVFASVYAAYLLTSLFGLANPGSFSSDENTLRCAQVLFATAFSFFSALTLLTVLVEVPVDRYILPAAVFLPASLGLLCLILLEKLGFSSAGSS